MTIARAGRIIAVLVSLAAACAAARAETLDDAWARALQNDNALAAVRSQADAAGLEAEAAHAQRWPTVAVGASFSQLDDSPAFDFSWTGLGIKPPELFKNDQLVMGTASITVPLFTSGRISSSIETAEARRRGAGAQLTAATADTRLAVADAYVTVLRARRALAVARSNVQSLESLLRDTSSMFERELVPKNELLAAQVTLADAKQKELRAANAAEVALAAYNRRLGEPMTRAVDLADTIEIPVALPASLEALTQQALSRRSELAMLDAQAEAYGSMARTERSRTLPQLALTGGYQYLENQFLDDQTVGMAGIGVQWALFDGGQARKRAAALEHSSRAAAQQRADAASLVELQVRQAWLDVREAAERVQVSQAAAEQSDESLRIARERYNSGLGTQTQLLEAETFRVQALSNRDDATFDAAMAKLRLARAVGAL